MGKLAAAIGAAMLFLGFYLFPLGQDSVTWLIMEYLTGGNYWEAVLYLYGICFGLIILGLLLLRSSGKNVEVRM